MDNPLRYKLYLKRNKAAIIKYMLPLVICIFIASASRVVVNNPRDELMLYTAKYQYYSIVESNNGKNVDRAYIEKIEDIEEVKAVYPFTYEAYKMNTFLCDNSMMLYKAAPECIMEIVSGLDENYDVQDILSLKEDEIIISDRISRCLKVNMQDHFLNAPEYKCAAIYHSDHPMAFYPTTEEVGEESYIILPKPGRRKEMNEKIRALDNPHIDISDYETMNQEDLETETQMSSSLNLAIIFITITSCIITGIMTYCHYYNRRHEMGILRAIGYSEKYLIKRITIELIITTVIISVLAVLMLGVFILMMNLCIAIPEGNLMFRFSKDIVNIMLIIPLFMLFFSITSTWIAFMSKDSIELIQKEK